MGFNDLHLVVTQIGPHIAGVGLPCPLQRCLEKEVIVEGHDAGGPVLAGVAPVEDL